MSYRNSVALQKAILDRLNSDAGLAALLAGAIFDAAPEGAVPELYATIGAEDVTVRRDSGGALARYRVELAIIGRPESFASVKQAAAAAEAALTTAPLAVAGARVLDLALERARARRGRHPARRRIDLTFRVVIDQTSD